MSTRPTRRDVLSGLAGVSLLPAFSRSLLAQGLPTNPDVAIVGAGSAGLSAARQLASAGKSVIVLEAMDRIGGRAFTESETFGTPFDWGCAWIHSADRNPYYPLAQQWKFDLARHDDGLDRVYYGARRFSEAEMRRVGQIRDRDRPRERSSCTPARWGGVVGALDPHAGGAGDSHVHGTDGHGRRLRRTRDP